ncbi:hypothetical protein Tco_0936402 [Tanacetum coccineum]
MEPPLPGGGAVDTHVGMVGGDDGLELGGRMCGRTRLISVHGCILVVESGVVSLGGGSVGVIGEWWDGSPWRWVARRLGLVARHGSFDAADTSATSCRTH